MGILSGLRGTKDIKRGLKEAKELIEKAAATQRPYAQWGEGYIEDFESMAYAPEKSRAYAQMLAASRHALRATGGVGMGGNMAMLGAHLGFNMPRLFASVRSSLQQSYGLPVHVGAKAAGNISDIYGQGAGLIAKGYGALGQQRAKTTMAIGEAIGKAFSYGQFSAGSG